MAAISFTKVFDLCVYLSACFVCQHVYVHVYMCVLVIFIALGHCRFLNQQYPHLAYENEYMKSLVAARENSDLNDNHLFVLHRFTLEHDRLQLGGALLPDLVEFYQWIHTHLSHLVTYERAQEIAIEDVIKLSAKRFPPKLHEHLTNLYHNFSGKLLFFKLPIIILLSFSYLKSKGIQPVHISHIALVLEC